MDHAGAIVYRMLIGLAIGALGLVFGNLTTLTMGDAGRQTGIASALMGVLQYLMFRRYRLRRQPRSARPRPATAYHRHLRLPRGPDDDHRRPRRGAARRPMRQWG